MILKELRNYKKISQNDLANELQILPRTLRRYENKESEPKIEMLIKLADFFNVSVDFLIGHKAATLDLNGLTEEQKILVQDICELNDIMCIKLNAYLQGLKQGEKEFKNNKNSNENIN